MLFVATMFTCQQYATAQNLDVSSWKVVDIANSTMSIKTPPGWTATTDSATGRVDVRNEGGASLSVVPFFIAGQTVESLNPKNFFELFIKAFAPQETWSQPSAVGNNAFRATYKNDAESASSAIVFAPAPNGVAGQVAVAKVPKSASDVNQEFFGAMLSSIRYKMPANSPEMASAPTNSSAPPTVAPNNEAAMESDEDEGDEGDDGGDGSSGSSGESAAQYQSPQSDTPSQSEEQNTAQSSPPSFQPEQAMQEMPQPQGGFSFNGWTRFTDPAESSFSLDVPSGWKVSGRLDRVSALDVRPWVKAVSPDDMVTAFIGDGKISPCTMPTATGNALGFRTGRNYNGTVVLPYIPARKFAEKYARSNLDKFISNITVVEEHYHPDVALAVNGTVGATHSEAASIKLTGMYGSIPAVAYYLAVTKATVAHGTGMWWVTKLAGVVCPADRDAEGLGVILHMLQSFEVNQDWSSNSLRNTAAVSRHYTQVSQQISRSISDRYWSQQAHNERMNQAYWNRQASQDRAANNFSNYIRGVENVQDPNSGQKYQVQYGPQAHYLDPTGNYIVGGDNGAPGPDWSQLMSVP